MAELPVVVTGATGFLGRRLVAQLEDKGYEVIQVSRSLGFDICDLESLNEIPPFKALFHLAAKTFVPDAYNESASFYTTNVLGTLNALELCKRFSKPIFFASSYLYGQPKSLPVNEEHPIDLWNPYATSKIIGEQLCQAYSKDFGFPATALRIFNVYGEGQSENFLIPKIISGLEKGCLQLQAKDSKRDFVYVKDVADAFIKAFESDLSGYQFFNVGSGVNYSVGELVKIVSDIMKVSTNVEYSQTHRKNEVLEVLCDNTKIYRSLGWKPETSMTTGLTQTVRSVNSLQ